MDQPNTSESVADQQLIRPKSGPRGKAALIRKLKLRYPELGPAEIAKRVGCSRQSAGRVLTTFLSDHSETDLREFQENTADIYDALKFRFLESVTPAKISNTSAQAAVVSAAILHDKAALMRGQATAINVSVLLDVAGMIRRDSEQ